MFDLLFISQTYTPLYIISDSEMKELERTQNHEEISNQKKRLEEAYKAQIKHLQQREKELRNELKTYESKKKKV